jgi:hypothetical protein
MASSATASHDVTATSAQSAGYSPLVVLATFAQFSIAALALLQMIFYWGANVQVSWLGLVVALAIGAGLTLAFRGRLQRR